MRSSNDGGVDHRPVDCCWRGSPAALCAVTQRNGSTPLEVIEALLCEAWGQVECDEDTLVVGEANGTEIYRTVAIYPQTSEENEDAN